MARTTHRHDNFHRGNVPESQLGTGTATDGYVLTATATGTAAWEANAGGSGTERRILLADGHATPFTFDDLLQMDDGSDFMWSD